MHQHRAPPPTIVDLAAALSDAPPTRETSAWLIGPTASAAVLELRPAAPLPDAQPITRTDGLAAWASRRRGRRGRWDCASRLQGADIRVGFTARRVIFGVVGGATFGPPALGAPSASSRPAVDRPHTATTITAAERARIARLAQRAPVRLLLRQANLGTLLPQQHA
jgi:hypothetical protein